MSNPLLLSVIQGQAFEVTTLTGVIVRMPRMPNLIDAAFPGGAIEWKKTPSATKKFAIDTVQHRVGMLPTLGRNEPLPNSIPSDYGMIELPIPKGGRRMEVTVDEILERRKPGTNELFGMDELAAQKISLVQKEIEMWSTWSKYRALDGLVVDFPTKRILHNVLQLMNVKQMTFTWDFTAAGFSPNDEVAKIREKVEDNVSGAPVLITGYKLLCGRQFFRVMRQNAQIVAAWNLWTAFKTNMKSLGMTYNQIPGGFEIADDVMVYNMGKDRIWQMDANGNYTGGSVGFIDDYSAYLVPVTADDMYETVFGPANKMQWFGNTLPRYVTPRIKGDDTGIELDIEAYEINYLQRPDLVVKIGMTTASKALAGPNAADVEADVTIEPVA